MRKGIGKRGMGETALISLLLKFYMRCVAFLLPFVLSTNDPKAPNGLEDFPKLGALH